MFGEFVETARALKVGLKAFSNNPRLKATFPPDTHTQANSHSLGSKAVCACVLSYEGKKWKTWPFFSLGSLSKVNTAESRALLGSLYRKCFELSLSLPSA